MFENGHSPLPNGDTVNNGGLFSTMPVYIADKFSIGKLIGDGNFAVVRQAVER